jgi:dynein intermediate chain, cytosolic
VDVVYTITLHEPDMTEEERTAILANPELTEFVDFHSKIIERMISDNYDYIRDYKAGAESGLCVC